MNQNAGNGSELSSPSVCLSSVQDVTVLPDTSQIKVESNGADQMNLVSNELEHTAIIREYKAMIKSNSSFMVSDY